MKSHIAAGIVTFEPDLERLRQNLVSVSPQVDVVYVYDNGSANSDEISRLLSEVPNAHLLSAETNSGIANALNVLARRAIESGYDCLLTLDQDSVCPPDMVTVLEGSNADAVAMVTPYIVDRNKLTVEEFHAMNLDGVDCFKQAARRGAITSGALLWLDAWEAVGGFDEKFFIDYVDYDFNQRLMSAGYRILRANQTYLLHEVGKAHKSWLVVPRKDLVGRWRWERFYAFGHSPQRCYYKARNRVFFTRKYGRELGITHEGAWQIPQQVALTLMFESGRKEKALAFWRGLVDGVRTPIS